jgi:four helix bundle protein
LNFTFSTSHTCRILKEILMEEDNLIVRLSFKLALDNIKYCELLETQKKYLMAKQLFRSGTSIGAHVSEAQGAESRDDFIHKMKGGYKEACETNYWFELCKKTASYPDPGKLLEDSYIVIKVLGKIIGTSKGRRK